MKKKKIVQFLGIFIIMSVMLISLTGCMSSRLRSDSLSKKLLIDGYRVTFVSATELIEDGYKNYKIKEVLYAEGKADTAKEGNIVAVYYCGNYDSANWVENKCKNAETTDASYKGFVTYRYNYTIVHGHYDAVRDVRGY